jgi:hypothetical protein
VVDEHRLDIEDSIPESRRGSGRAVVCLIRMQEVKLTGQADATRAAVAERLDTGDGDADRVRVMPMRLEPARREVSLRARDPVDGRPEPKRVRPQRARSFKTAVIAGS